MILLNPPKGLNIFNFLPKCRKLAKSGHSGCELGRIRLHPKEWKLFWTGANDSDK